MILVLAILASVFFLDGVWRFVLIGAAAAIEIAELSMWLRWRGRRAQMGAEAMVGTVGIAATDCRPEGQVKLKGQLWNARCDSGVEEGDEVVVDRIDGLRLIVSPR
jgi:membrane-bound serine protease (ClpP class)